MRTISDNEFMQLQDLDVNTKVERLANVFTPVEFDARLTDLRTHGRDRGSFKPFWDQWGDKFLIRPKELTIVFGSRGSYKSTVVNYLIADWLMAGKGRAGLISYEMEPEDLLIMFIEQMANSTDFTDDFAAQAMS